MNQQQNKEELVIVKDSLVYQLKNPLTEALQHMGQGDKLSALMPFGSLSLRGAESSASKHAF